jgi:hypothetical protein
MRTSESTPLQLVVLKWLNEPVADFSSLLTKVRSPTSWTLCRRDEPAIDYFVRDLRIAL